MTWSKGIVHWRENGVINVSVAFTWYLADAWTLCQWSKLAGDTVRAGGPAVALMPDYLADVATVGGDLPVLARHNLDATFTTRGCIRQCPFCAVPRIEGEFRELTEWEVKPMVCDNNLLAASRVHFDRVIDRLKGLRGVDFNQGLDARLLTDHHVARLAELDLPIIRFAWDHVGLESEVMDAIDRILTAGVAHRRIRCYVLLGYYDTRDDALYRLERLRAKGIRANPMRFQSLDALVKNSFDKEKMEDWTDRELRRMMRYWNRQNWLSKVPYAEYEAR